MFRLLVMFPLMISRYRHTCMNPILFSNIVLCTFCLLKKFVSTKSVLRHYYLLHIRRTQLIFFSRLDFVFSLCFTVTVVSQKQ